MVNLTNENKEIIRKYYYDMYELKLNMKGIYDSKEIEKAKKFIDEKISLYLLNRSKKNFSAYIADDKLDIRKPKIENISISKLFLEAKNGKLECTQYIIRYYQIILEYKINTKYNNIANKEELIESGKKYVEEIIKKYVSKNKSTSLVNYMQAYVFPSFFENNNLGTIDNLDRIYKNIYNSAINRIKYQGLLSSEEVQNFVMAYSKEKINNYIKNNGENKNKLIIYMETVISRLINYCKDEEQTLIRYNRFFDNRYEDTLNYFYYKYRYLIDELVDKNDLSQVLRYEIIFKKVIKEYVDNNINKRITLSPNLLKVKLNELTKLNKKESNFNYDLARNGTKQDKREQKNILLEELEYMKNDFKDKYIFYTDKDSVDEKIDLAYKNSVTAYIDGITSKNPKSYVWTRMDQALKPFSELTRKKIDKSKLKVIYRKKAYNVVNSYIKYKNLSGKELDEFIEYCNVAFNNYINKGYYENIRLYMVNAIMKYDSKFNNEIQNIKNLYLNKKI